MLDSYIVLVYILAYIGLFATSFYIINLFLYYRKKKDPLPATDKFVSILIPAYNEEKSIVSTIKSALKLDYPVENLEVIVIDDGSSDNTYEMAKKFESLKNPRVRVFTKKNGGKGSALNYGIEKARGEIVISMDADTFVKTDALKIMVGYFADEHVMSVAPSMGILKPSSLWGRIVQIEYYMGVFLRKSFATMNAVHITPGAFSAYRKSFFDKYGGYDEGNLTEDLEVALRIQSKHGVIENATKAAAYTISPESFRALLFQRRRWYVGLIRNLWAYKRLFGFKHGPLGAVVLPVAVSTVILSVVLTIYSAIKILIEIKDELVFFNSINFRFNNTFELNSYLFERFFYTIFSQPIFIMALLFIALLGFYVYFSKRQMIYKDGVKVNFIFFSLFYSFLFAFWWIVSFIYVIFNKDVMWREDKK